jgi:hypothetical protein
LLLRAIFKRKVLAEKVYNQNTSHLSEEVKSVKPTGGRNYRLPFAATPTLAATPKLDHACASRSTLR